MSEQHRSYRASEMPLLMKCGGAAHPEPGEPLIDSHNEAADLGSAVHEIMATIVRDELDHVPACTPVAQRWSVDADELAGLSAAGLKCWRKVQGWLCDLTPIIEQRYEINMPPRGTLSGHIDLAGWHRNDDEERVPLIIDWKTGRLDSNHYDQMAAYALLWMAYDERVGNDPADRYIVIPVWVRDAEVEVYEFTPGELREWERRVEDDVIDWDGTYHPGAHCQHCPRFASCPARRAMIHSTIADLDTYSGSVEDMAAALVSSASRNPDATDRLADLYERAKAIEDITDRLKRALREQIGNQYDGILEGNEKRLAVETQQRRYLKSRKGWSVLSQHVEPTKLLDAVSISRTKALDLIAAEFPRGHKKQAKEEVEADLDAAGAVEVKEIKRLSVKRTSASIERKSDG